MRRIGQREWLEKVEGRSLGLRGGERERRKEGRESVSTMDVTTCIMTAPRDRFRHVMWKWDFSSTHKRPGNTDLY